MMLYTLVALAALSCQGQLDEVVYSNLTDDNAFTSGENAQAAVNAMYTPLHSLYREPMFYFNDVSVDSGYKGGSPFEVLNDQGIYNDNRTLNAWNYLYQIASRANIVIDHIPEMAERNFRTLSKAQLLGEAYFMRAFAYYNLTDIFFQVPLVTDSRIEVTAKEPLTSIDAIEAQIEKDLLLAKEYLPKHYGAREDAGRPTYGAATGYLCRLYMRQAGRARVAGKDDTGPWRDALFEANDLLALEGVEYNLQPTVWEVFDPSSEAGLYNGELIFAVRASDKTLASGSWDLGLQFTPWAYDMGWSNILQQLEMTWLFTPGDQRLKVLQVTEYPDVYHPEKTYYMAPETLSQTGSIPFNHTVSGVTYEEMVELDATFTQKYKYLYTRQYNYNTPNNLPLLRLADMILCKAEILNELNGPSAEAVGLVNRIRERAFGDTAHNLKLADYPTKEAFRSALCDERLYELNMECLRRPDLIRMGLWKSRMQGLLRTVALKWAAREQNESREAGYYDGSWAAYPAPESLTDDDIRMFMPIPYREVTLNPDLAGARTFEALPTPDEPDTPVTPQPDPEYTYFWDFDDLSGWSWSHQNDTPASGGRVEGGYVILTTRAGTQDRAKCRTNSRIYAAGRYTWRVEVPAVDAGDQVSVGAFLYKDDAHELDFEIGYGTTDNRASCGALAGEMVACMTSQSNPHVSSYTPVSVGWHTVELDLQTSGDRYRAIWLIDGKACQEKLLSYGPETKFSIHCSVENLSFMGTVLPRKDYSARFDYVGYKSY